MVLSLNPAGRVANRRGRAGAGGGMPPIIRRRNTPRPKALALARAGAAKRATTGRLILVRRLDAPVDAPNATQPEFLK